MIVYCTQCGQRIAYRIPEGDQLPRACCRHCGHIQYENPRLVVGCVAEHESRILLCRRAIEPRHGYWTLPAGFMENGETTREGAIRETLEESGLTVDTPTLFAMVSIPHIHQVHLFYRASVRLPGQPHGSETLEIGFFEESDIPWEHLAFTSVRYCLARYLEDRQKAAFGYHEAAISADYQVIPQGKT